MILLQKDLNQRIFSGQEMYQTIPILIKPRQVRQIIDGFGVGAKSTHQYFAKSN